MDIRDFIGTGKEYAVTTTEISVMTGLTDREVRAAIHEARKSTVILNMQDGEGYFMPTEDETELVEKWVRQETSRFINNIAALGSAKKMLKNAEEINRIEHFLEVMRND